jgi:D-aspartate ligase
MDTKLDIRTMDTEAGERILGIHTNRLVPVLIGGNNNVNNLGVARNLGRHGVPVILLDYERPSIARSSRYIHKRLACPNPSKSEIQYIDFLINYGKQMDEKCVILPTNDAAVLALSRYKEELEQYYLLPIPGFEVVETLVNKKLFYQFLDQVSIPHPRTYFPTDIANLESISHEIEFPYIIKPTYSHLFDAEFATKCFLIKSSQDLKNAVKRLENKDLDVFIQEIIPGNEHYSLLTYFNRRAEPLAICGWDKLKQFPPDFGMSSSLCKSVWRGAPICLAIQILKALKYHGIAEPEFKKDPRDGQYKFLEINARTSVPIALPARCGVNIEYTAYLDTIGRYNGNIVFPQGGILWINEITELVSCIKQIRKGKLNIREVVKSHLGKKVYATAAWDDPLPLVTSLYNFTRHYLEKREKALYRWCRGTSDDVWHKKEKISDLSITEVNDNEIFRSLRETWNRLLQQCSDNNIFLTWEWLFTWWQHYGRDKKLRIFLIKDSDKIIGIAPLMQSKYRIGFISVNVIENLCSERCDYGGIILAEKKQESIAILLNYLEKTIKYSNTIVRLFNIPENSSFLTVLREQYPAFSKSLYMEERLVDYCSVIDLPATWEEYLQSLSKKRRGNLRRAMKLLTGNHHKLEFKKYNVDDDLQNQLLVLFKIHEKRWQAKNIRSKFIEPEAREFYLDVSKAFHQNNWLDLSFLEIDGKPVSVEWGFNYNNIHWAMTGAFDPGYSDYSVGNLHMMKLIEDTIQNKLKKYDLLTGTENYKSLWTNCKIHNKQIIMTKRRFGGRYRVKYFQIILRVDNILRLGLRQYYHLRVENKRQRK